MINRRSVGYILTLFIVVIFISSLLGLFDFKLIEIISYSVLLLSLNMFYNAINNKNKIGTALSCFLFLTGSLIFVLNRFEILNISSIIIPAFLFMLGLSLLIGNILIEWSRLSTAFSLISIFIGFSLLIKRSSTNMHLYLSAVYALIVEYWIIILFLIVVVFISTLKIRGEKSDRSDFDAE